MGIDKCCNDDDCRNEGDERRPEDGVDEPRPRIHLVDYDHVVVGEAVERSVAVGAQLIFPLYDRLFVVIWRRAARIEGTLQI